MLKQKTKFKILQGQLHHEANGLTQKDLVPFIHREIFLLTKKRFIPKMRYGVKLNDNMISLTWTFCSLADQRKQSSEITTKMLKRVLAKFNQLRLLQTKDNVVFLDSWFRTEVIHKAI